jgi:hypothetical protein
MISKSQKENNKMERKKHKGKKVVDVAHLDKAQALTRIS